MSETIKACAMLVRSAWDEGVPEDEAEARKEACVAARDEHDRMRAELAAWEHAHAEERKAHEAVSAEAARLAGELAEARGEVERLTQDHGDLLVANARERARAEKVEASVERLTRDLAEANVREGDARRDHVAAMKRADKNAEERDLSQRAEGTTRAQRDDAWGEYQKERARAERAEAEVGRLREAIMFAVSRLGPGKAIEALRAALAPAETKGEGT